MMALPSCAAEEGKGAAGSGITIIPATSLCCPMGPCGAAWGCGVTAVEGTQVAACPGGCVCVCVYVWLKGLNLPVGDVIKAPHSAGSDGGTAAEAADEGINIKQACEWRRPSSHSLTYILIIRPLSNKTWICSFASLFLVFAAAVREIHDGLQYLDETLRG